MQETATHEPALRRRRGRPREAESPLGVQWIRAPRRLRSAHRRRSVVSHRPTAMLPPGSTLSDRIPARNVRTVSDATPSPWTRSESSPSDALGTCEGSRRSSSRPGGPRRRPTRRSGGGAPGRRLRAGRSLGINLYPGLSEPDWLEFDSMINLRPSFGNRSRGVDDPGTRDRIGALVKRLVRR